MSLLDDSQFIIQKKLLSAHEHYDFLDLQGNKLAEAEGSIIQVPAKFDIKDNHDVLLLHLQGKAVSLHHEFAILGAGGEELAVVRKKVATFGGQEYWAQRPDGSECMRIYGDFTNHEYNVEADGQTVAQVTRKWVSLRDQMGVSITGNVDHRVVIGAAIVIEHIECTEHHNSGGAGFAVNMRF